LINIEYDFTSVLTPLGISPPPNNFYEVHDP
jgi:hypothetical protein